MNKLVVTINKDQSDTFKLAKSKIYIMQKRWGRYNPEVDKLVEQAIGKKGQLHQVFGELGLAICFQTRDLRLVSDHSCLTRSALGVCVRLDLLRRQHKTV